MWFPPIEAMRTGRPETAFVLAMWHELFDPFTPDSFQPRLHNCSTLASELVYVTERALAAKPWERHAHQIRQELRAVALMEEDLLEGIPKYRYLVECLLKSDDPNEALLYERVLTVSGAQRDVQKVVRKVGFKLKSRHDVSAEPFTI